MLRTVTPNAENRRGKLERRSTGACHQRGRWSRWAVAVSVHAVLGFPSHVRRRPGVDHVYMRSLPAPLWRLAGDHANIGYSLTFLHRGYGANVQDHSARRRMRFPHRLAEQISDVTDLHPLLHVPAALDHGIENAPGFAGDAGNVL